ncbi:LPS-assembly protein LptD, partial [bacterium]|nr:LPS-assembly protein LptD [bacterium]
MRIRNYIALTAIFIFLLIIPTEVYADDEQIPPITLSADYLEYIKEGNIILGNGNVRIEHIDTVITADEIIANLDKDEIEIQGNVVIVDKTGELKGESGIYNIRTQKGTLVNATTYDKPWYVKGKKVDKIGEEKVIIHRGSFTTCDLSKPHYSFRAKKINIYPGDKIVARNVFLFVDK